MSTLTKILEERMKNLIEQNSKEHKEIRQSLESVNETLKEAYVPLSRFYPIEKIVYSLVGVILTAFVLGLIALVFKPL